MYLYEAHITVADTEVSQAFYIDVVGLRFAHRDATRDILFLWAGEEKISMLGLWGPTTTFGRSLHASHLAFRLSLDELFAAEKRLRARGVTTFNFQGEKTSEPSVIGWMPSAQLYFNDPDGHSLEFIALLDDAPDPPFIGTLFEWRMKRLANE